MKEKKKYAFRIKGDVTSCFKTFKVVDGEEREINCKDGIIETDDPYLADYLSLDKRYTSVNLEGIPLETLREIDSLKKENEVLRKINDDLMKKISGKNKKNPEVKPPKEKQKAKDGKK